MQLHRRHALDTLCAKAYHEDVEEVPLFLRVVAREEDHHHVQAVQPDLHVGAALDVSKHGGGNAGDCTCVLAHHDQGHFVVFKCKLFPDFVDIHGEDDDAHLIHNGRDACGNDKQYFIQPD